MVLHSRRRVLFFLVYSETAKTVQVRAFAKAAYDTLMKSGASKGGPPPQTRDITSESSLAKVDMISILPEGLKSNRELTLSTSLDFQANLVADLVFARNLVDQDTWNRCIASFIQPWFLNDSAAAEGYAELVRSHYEAIDRAKFAVGQYETDEEGELLCDTTFSLAYGTLLLLSHTKLRLVRGRRYGILGSNGSGKSTLMRQLRDGKVENFPPQSELRCIMVEHALQGEDTSMSIVDFIACGTLGNEHDSIFFRR